MLHVSGTRRRVYLVEEMPTNDTGDFINPATRVQSMINNNLTGLLLKHRRYSGNLENEQFN